MEEPLCGGRNYGGTQHDKRRVERAHVPNARRNRKGISDTPWKPGQIGIVDGERETLPE